ncbi:MAG: PEGA domain-containing protein [Chitinispirillales bacterium]|jgi:hypothetical protein|nr:PEGA domain-containing protein [Chitinispirillales bacterium]
MNTKRLLISLSTVIPLLFAAASFAQMPDLYAVAAFGITDIERTERGNFFIQPSKVISDADTLREFDSPPSFIRPGQVVMRKKFGADYRLYIGDLDTAAFRAFPPLYAFPMPAWSRSGQAMWYRFYTEPTGNRNLDLETVFFDNERIYVQHHQKIYYSRNDEWGSITGVAAAPYGELHIDSEPPGADIYIYGKATGKKTPAVLKNMIAGRYEIELFLPDYRFRRRSVHVPQGDTASNSFQLMSDFDTLLVLGEHQHGTLVLPYPPINSDYSINDSTITTFHKQLLEGDYRVTWSGEGLYRNIDTVIHVPAGQMAFFNTPFIRLTGTAAFRLNPRDALICVEGFPCHLGDLTVELPSGFHTARITRHGYEPERRRFVISHGKIFTIRVKLEGDNDRDRDGFPDSIDRCPDVYGLYDGCPRPDIRTMYRLKYWELNEYMETEPFSFSVSVFGLINRSPTNRNFHNFLASFSGGRSGGLNNYKGLTLGNIYQVSYRGFLAQLELGQWLSGVKFRRPDTLTINTERDRYIVWYDSLYVDPAIFFPSTALSAGFKYRLDKYSVGYSLGFQWENIVIDQIERFSDRSFTSVTFDNNWWYHELMVEADFFTEAFFTPSLYAKLKFPFGPVGWTRWHVIQMGMYFRLRPVYWKGRI